MENLKKELLQDLQKEDKNIDGVLNIIKDKAGYIVTGKLHTEIRNVSEYIESWFAFKGITVTVNISLTMPKLSIIDHNNEVESTTIDEDSDHVNVLYFGPMELRKITPNNKYKRMNFDTVEKVRAAVEVAGYIHPILINSRYEIIDGNLRYEVAKRYGSDTIMVVMIDDSNKKADFLRLVINRSEEFQRWIYSDVDEYVDNIPALGPVLEPLGFYGNNILPVSYFGNTILDYRLDSDNAQMSEYVQSKPLAEWAADRTREIKEEEERKKAIAAQKSPRKTADMFSLFDMQPNPEDFVKTYDAKEEIAKNVEEMKERAEIITNNYDEHRIKTLGVDPDEYYGTQKSRRTTQAKVADIKKQRAIETALEEMLKVDIENGTAEFINILTNESVEIPAGEDPQEWALEYIDTHKLYNDYLEG